MRGGLSGGVPRRKLGTGPLPTLGSRAGRSPTRHGRATRLGSCVAWVSSLEPRPHRGPAHRRTRWVSLRDVGRSLARVLGCLFRLEGLSGLSGTSGRKSCRNSSGVGLPAGWNTRTDENPLVSGPGRGSKALAARWRAKRRRCGSAGRSAVRGGACGVRPESRAPRAQTPPRAGCTPRPGGLGGTAPSEWRPRRLFRAPRSAPCSPESRAEGVRGPTGGLGGTTPSRPPGREGGALYLSRRPNTVKTDASPRSGEYSQACCGAAMNISSVPSPSMSQWSMNTNWPA